jgi:hypothetical protein
MQLSPRLETPIALGSDFAALPNLTADGERISRIVLAEATIDPYHALITAQNGELLIADRNSQLGTQINGVRLPSSTLFEGDRLQIGSFQIQVLSAISRPANVTNSQTGGCDRQVGFLIKRRCGRTDATNCPDCNGEMTAVPYSDPYFYDRNLYHDFGAYSGGWGNDYYSDRDCYSYNPDTGSIDFTEADSTSLEQETEVDYEQDMGAS